MGAGARIVAAAATALVAALVCAAPGSAAVNERLTTVATPSAPGPAQYNQVTVHEFGSKKADHVLVLMPGTSGGAGDFTLDARWLVKNVPDLQVWAVDRREDAFEDTAMFKQGLAGQKSLQEVFDYYLGWISGATPPSHFNFLDASQYGFTREWGMAVALNDVRAVIRRASKGGRSVVLGGHSLGASLTAAYATWDFAGKPGFRDLDGIVLIDGGLLGSFDAFDLAQAQQQIADLATGNPFLDLLGIGVPEAAGLFAEVGGLYAKRAPTADASVLQNFPLLPAEFKPPVSVTNRALFGYAFDRDTSPAGLGLLHVNAGGLADMGTPRDWADGGVTPVARLADTFGQEPTNAVEWYFPKRLTIDTNGANELTENDVAQFLGLRLEHLKQVDVPLYAFQTDLTQGGVLNGARALIRKSKTTEGESTLVDRTESTAHLDPLTAAPRTNAFLKTVKPFLSRAFGGD